MRTPPSSKGNFHFFKSYSSLSARFRSLRVEGYRVVAGDAKGSVGEGGRNRREFKFNRAGARPRRGEAKFGKARDAVERKKLQYATRESEMNR